MERMEKKIAAIWARISSPGQTSLPDQVARAKGELEKQGFTVPEELIITTEWTSLDLFSCPKFLRLAGLVRRKEIQGIGMLDRDRLHAEPSQRLAFLAECRGAGVQWVICQGPPMLEGDWGELIEHVYAISKKQQVLRAKLGAKDGLHDRVTKDRKPTSRHKVLGYRWETETRLVPDDNWDTIKLILDLVLKGVTYRQIVKELGRRGILSPSGNLKWEQSTISSTIARNPIYAGRYYALSKEVVEPKKRTGETCGNSSARTIPLDQRVYLPEVEILDPPITWEQYLQIQERVKRNKELAQRNAKHNYLLRGFIFCETHRGKKGEPRRYHGQPYQAGWRYACPIGGCAHSYLRGTELEDRVKKHTKWLLEMPPDLFYEHVSNQHSRDETEQSLRKELHSLELKYDKNISAETDLEKRDLLGQENPEVYRRLKAGFQAERTWIEERTQAINDGLAQLNLQAEAAMSLQEIQAGIKGRLDHLTNAEWRELFTTLNLELHIRDENDLATWEDYGFDEELNPMDNYDQWWEQTIEYEKWIDIRFGLPLMRVPTDRVSEIVFKRAGT